MSDSGVTVVSETGNGPYTELVLAGKHVMAADEPEALGGRDSGASPYQFLMAALGACTAMTLRGYALRHGWPVGKITVRLRHKKISIEDKKVDRFEREIDCAGPLTAEQQSRMLTVAEACPVSQTLQRGSLVASQLTSVAAPVEGHAIAAPPAMIEA